MVYEARRVLIVGDDFTPASLFAEAIQGFLGDTMTSLEMTLVDMGDAPYDAGPVDDVREFVGTPGAFIDRLARVQAIVTTFAPITAQVLAEAPELELIVSGRGGPVNIDVREARARDVLVAYVPGRNAEAVAEYVLGVLVTLTRRIDRAQAWLRDGQWTSGREDTFDKPTGWELEHRVLGLIGFGAIGSRVAELVGPLRMQVIATDPVVSPARMRERGVEPVDLSVLLARADVISVHARPSEHGGVIIGAAELGSMPRGRLLINSSRGVNVDERAVAAALVSGHLAGAALDVFAAEPLPADDPLLAAPNLILTPHIAGISEDVPRRTAMAVASAVADWVRGKPQRHLM